MLKKRDRIIASIRKWQTRCLKRSHKFGIKLPNTVEEAYVLDAKNGNTLWQMPYPKQWKMSECHLKYYKIRSQYSLVTNLLDPI